MKVISATHENLSALAELFDGYRVFYKQQSDRQGAEAFLTERLNQKDSVIFIALTPQGQAMGFVQLYPSFTSVGMKRILILNDLYVAPDCRRQRVAQALIEHTHRYAIKSHAHKVTLMTAVDNGEAQSLYEKCGYQLDEAFKHYNFVLK